jgi:NAD-dependent dihydropyrimidine dehydrogenase PreA subunit
MILVINDKCDFCGACVAVCPVDCIDLYEARIEIQKSCIDCVLCVWICPVETLAPQGAMGVDVCEATTTAS